MNVVAGVVLTAVMLAYSTLLYAIVLRQREEDRRHFAKVAADLRNKARVVRADLDALMAYVGAESPVDESGDDTAPLKPRRGDRRRPQGAHGPRVRRRAVPVPDTS